MSCLMGGGGGGGLCDFRPLFRGELVSFVPNGRGGSSVF